MGVYRLRSCKACTGEACADKSPPIPPLNFHAWPACPVSLLRGPHWQYIVQLYNAKTVSPLGDWPHRYAAWVVDGLTALERAFAAKIRNDAKTNKRTGLPGPGHKKARKRRPKLKMR